MAVQFADNSAAMHKCELFFVCFYLVLVGTAALLSRHKRLLIFPKQAPTRHQFIAGIGIPADLSYESLTVGYVLKAQFFLPDNETVYRENAFWPEYPFDRNYTYHDDEYYKDYYTKHQRSVSPLRWRFYDYLINRIETYGLNGRECLLRAICEANAIHFDRHHNVFAQILHILFKPSSSSDALNPETMMYTAAERLGSNQGSCLQYMCDISLIDWISNKLQI